MLLTRTSKEPRDFVYSLSRPCCHHRVEAVSGRAPQRSPRHLVWFGCAGTV